LNNVAALKAIAEANALPVPKRAAKRALIARSSRIMGDEHTQAWRLGRGSFRFVTFGISERVSAGFFGVGTSFIHHSIFLT